MSDQPTAPQNTSNSGSNGKHEIQPDQEAKMNSTYTHGKLEDFSQNRINRGQQTINYWIAEADKKIVDALKKLSEAVAQLGGNVGPVNLAIEEVSAAAGKIAGEFPPGCTDPN